ncbi:MAG: cell division protein SepF [Clostridia bacterium]|nr:cell division protein SepF [Clostridia bacterium]
MGFFNFLKNGITLEKKKVQVAEPEPTEVEDTNEEETIETNETLTPEAEQPAMPMFSSQPTIEDQRMEAASVLLGDNGLTGGSTPSLIQIAQPTQVAVPISQPTPVQTTTETQPQIFNTHNNVSGNFNNALLGQVSANQNLLVIAPQNSAEISTILTNLANGNACIVSLSKFSIPEAQRFLDYICGFVNAISGMIMQRSSNEFILTPKGVNIKNS